MKEEWIVYRETYDNGHGHLLWEVSNYGRVKKNGELFELKTHNQRYYRVCGRYLHRIVAELFIPNPDNKPCIDHIDANKLNNRVDNLRWCTPKENSNNPLTIKKREEFMNSEHYKKAMSASITGNCHSKETRKKISNTKKEYFKINTHYLAGKKRITWKDESGKIHWKLVS